MRHTRFLPTFFFFSRERGEQLKNCDWTWEMPNVCLCLSSFQCPSCTTVLVRQYKYFVPRAHRDPVFPSHFPVWDPETETDNLFGKPFSILQYKIFFPTLTCRVPNKQELLAENKEVLNSCLNNLSNLTKVFRFMELSRKFWFRVKKCVERKAIFEETLSGKLLCI